ncbi:MAG: ATP-binding protein [Nanobdellota archaeon]
MKGQIISGDFNEILVRKKSDEDIEIGELLIAERGQEKILLQAKDLVYGSQINQQNIELISGMSLEEGNNEELFDKHLRIYTLAKLKSILTIDKFGARLPKNLPGFFSEVREVKKEDLNFITKPAKPLSVGQLRSGSKEMDLPVHLNGEKALSHHILIPATTGRGKSNLLSCMIWDSMDKDYCGMLVLDPHDEYYGRNDLGMKDHPQKPVYYTTKDVPAGQRTLAINLEKIKPHHFNGSVEWSRAQSEALHAYYKKYREKWIESIILEKPVENFHEGTLGVLKRRMLSLLNLSFENNRLICNGAFQLSSGENTIEDICNDLEKGKTVIIDTSNFSGAVEILIGSMITGEVFSKYKHYKMKGLLEEKPVISVVLEEAPRVLGKEVLEKGPNIFSSIAREGRKFNIGLTAVTQLPSLIPREILANMNTKIILGIEMQSERQAIIESASQDLSEDSKAIASLDVGEALISSNFMKFAAPVKIPYFRKFAEDYQNRHNKEKYKKSFEGVGL